MKNVVKMTLAAMLMTIGLTASHASLWSALKDKVSGSDPAEEEAAAAQQAAAMAATPAPAEAGKGRPRVKIVEGTPPPNSAAKPTADKETIRKGAQKLSQEINAERIPGDLFQRYAGKWKGDFWVYSPAGKKEQSQAASVEYTLNGDGTMKMESFYFDRISKTWVTAETATYVNEGNSIRVTIKRPNGDVAKQTGHFNDGQLFLTADINDGVEHYRERIDGKRLLVDGFGVYKGQADSHVFIGRFLRER
ncbi:MAG: lipocalin family protein [Candidatus Sumerlaeaceae bacterium]